MLRFAQPCSLHCEVRRRQRASLFPLCTHSLHCALEPQPLYASSPGEESLAPRYPVLCQHSTPSAIESGPSPTHTMHSGSQNVLPLTQREGGTATPLTKPLESLPVASSSQGSSVPSLTPQYPPRLLSQPSSLHISTQHWQHTNLSALSLRLSYILIIPGNQGSLMTLRPNQTIGQ